MAKKNANGEGTKWKTKAGLWRGRVVFNGKTASVSDRTKIGCATKLRAAATALRAGSLPSDDRLTVAQYLTAWIEGKRESLRARTWDTYEQHIRLHILPTEGSRRLVDLSPLHVTALMGRVVDSGATATTAQRVRATLRSALADAVTDGVLDRNVASRARAPKAMPPPVRWLDEAEARRFLEAAQADRAGDALTLTLLLGLRRGEVLGLKWIDIDWERASLKIQRGIYRKGGVVHEQPPKSRQSRRTLPLPEPAIEILRRQQARQAEQRTIEPDWQDTGYVWTSPSGALWGNTWLSNGLDRVLKAAGLPRITLHKLRHSTASILMEKDVHARVVADLLGHSQISLTLGTYSHATVRLVEVATTTMGDLTKPVSTPVVAQIIAQEASSSSQP